MQQKVSDYIANFLVEKGVTQVFCVVGGGAMHLDDSLGHHAGLRVLYQHHEQAAAMAAEGYARATGKPAVCCVTSGPGATNAITGVVGAYQDSIPMIVLSGQAKSTLCLHTSKVPLRTIGGQEVDIVPAVQGMTKYASIVLDPHAIRQELEHAYHEAVTGRPGPVWLDLPLDIQGSYVETEELVGDRALCGEWHPAGWRELDGGVSHACQEVAHSRRDVLGQHRPYRNGRPLLCRARRQYGGSCREFRSAE